MKTLGLAAVVALALLVAAPAPAAPAKGPTLKSLQTQITSLKKQVKTLKRQVTTAQNVAVASLAYGACSTAVTADTFQDTYAGLDSYFGAHTLPPYFGAQTVLNDYGSCRALSITRTHNQSPPSTSILRALIDLFKPSSAAAQESRMNFSSQARNLFGQFFVLLR